MSLLRTIEKRIETLVEGTFGRAFRSKVQPVEIARRLAREMDAHQQVSLKKVFVPNVYQVYLSRDDHEQLSAFEAALREELQEFLAEHARRSGYSTVTRPRVSIHRDRDLDLGAFGIAVEFDEPEGNAAAADEPAAGSTMVFQAPPVTPAAAAPAVPLRLVGPESAVELRDGVVRIGRGSRNDLVLADPSVSREHAEVRAGQGAPRIVDLGSTNGVLVNGTKVSDHPLTAGDQLLLGNVQLRCETAETDNRP